jgi:radical SAM-linked protein
VPAGAFRSKVRIRFRKGGDLRFTSHHDLMRTFERMLRRAALPFHSTQGFNPKPRLVFALSLPLGMVGAEEVVELELDAEMAPEEVHERLARQTPPGLVIRSVRRVDRRARARVRQATYRVALRHGWDSPGTQTEGLAQRIAGLLAAADCWVERTRPERRRLNVRPYLHAFRLLPDALEMDLKVTPQGSVRADEVLELLGLGDVLAEGAVLERARLELEDELPILERQDSA